MTTKFESSVRQIQYSQELVYSVLSQPSNIQKLEGIVPKDKLEKCHFQEDAITIDVPMAGKITLEIIEREQPKCIKMQVKDAPVQANAWIQLLPINDNTCKIKITIKAELNIMIKSMVKKPIEQALEKLADIIQVIPYSQLV